MSNFQDLVNTLPEESKELLKTELKKFEKFMNVDLKTLTGEQLSSLLASLSTEKQSLGVKVIQLETQLETQQKELERQTVEILEKYNIKDISELEKKKAEIESELQTQLTSLQELLTTFTEKGE